MKSEGDELLPREPSEVDGSAVVEGASGVLRAAQIDIGYMRISLWGGLGPVKGAKIYFRKQRLTEVRGGRESGNRLKFCVGF